VVTVCIMCTWLSLIVTAHIITYLGGLAFIALVHVLYYFMFSYHLE